MSLQDFIDIIIPAGSAIGGGILFWRGIAEYQRNVRIKRAEFLDKLISDFNNQETEIARSMLDDYVYVKSENRNDPPALQKEKAVSLKTYLRNHKDGSCEGKEPVGKPEEIIVRKSFDKLLDFFTKLSYYLERKLISAAELSYFKYYLEKIHMKEEVMGYINVYFYTKDFQILFDALSAQGVVRHS